MFRLHSSFRSHIHDNILRSASRWCLNQCMCLTHTNRHLLFYICTAHPCTENVAYYRRSRNFRNVGCHSLHPHTAFEGHIQWGAVRHHPTVHKAFRCQVFRKAVRSSCKDWEHRNPMKYRSLAYRLVPHPLKDGEGRRWCPSSRSTLSRHSLSVQRVALLCNWRENYALNKNIMLLSIALFNHMF